MSVKTIQCNLLVIGAGMAGMAAALFAANRGLSVVLAGSVGGIDFSTGMIDLLSIHPVKEGQRWDNPWDAFTALRRDEPEHPYALIPDNVIRQAINEFTEFLADAGVHYKGEADRNVRLLSPSGTTKSTYRVPGNMWHGVSALSERASCLLVDFIGLKGFSARQIAQVRKNDWPELQTASIAFPGQSGELYAEHLAFALTEPEILNALADAVKPHLKNVDYVGFPAVLGLYGAGDIQETLESLLGVKVFEIPTLPPSLNGIGLRTAFEKHLPDKGVRFFLRQYAHRVKYVGGDLRMSVAGDDNGNIIIDPKGVVYAGGRFFGKGLVADRQEIRDQVFGIHLHQPAGRSEWHRKRFYDPAGHPVNRAGIRVDRHFRPLGRENRIQYQNLYAAGAILAHQDWMRQKCGAGLAIASAFKAVLHFCRQFSTGDNHTGDNATIEGRAGK